LFFFCAYAAAIIVPVARIFKRVGITPWVSILALVPFVNLFGLWFFAFSAWPSDSAAAEQEEEWSEADKEKFRQLMRQK
jgi:formate/nitrite transporter FocA (FNT family)